MTNVLKHLETNFKTEMPRKAFRKFILSKENQHNTTNSHELHSKTGHWTIPKSQWAEMICHFCETMSV